MELLLEVGCEEIPARFVPPALVQLEEDLETRLKEARLVGDQPLRKRTMGTPRRLALRAGPLVDRQSDLAEEVLGPRVEAAYDQEGKPTKVCLGFAQSRGVDVSSLGVFETAKGKVVGFRRSVSGLPAREVLPGLLAELLKGLRFPKSMRWGDGEFAFARPVHWIVALLDDEVVPFRFCGVESGRTSRGHRFTAPAPFALKSLDSYPSELKSHGVWVEPAERRAHMMNEARRLATEAGGELIEDPKLEEEVAFLIESPVPLLGRFDQKFLALPREVLIAAMRNHQRYFSVEGKDGRLENAFVSIGNTPVGDPAVVRHGNERVLTARLTDAEFFFAEDRKISLVDRVPKLNDVVYQADLGSYYEKAHRTGVLAVAIAFQAGLGAFDKVTRVIEGLTVDLSAQKPAEAVSWRLARAAMLAKTDLLTEMVGEFPELQGVMGDTYARHGGEALSVATAIREQYLPRFSGDEVPKTDEGAILALADRLDSLAGCFGVGLRPTGTADPYALRRACQGVISIILDRGYHLSLSSMLERAVAGAREKIQATLQRKAKQKAEREAARKKQAVTVPELAPFEGPLLHDLMEFFAGRLKQRFAEEASGDVVEAVLASSMDDLTDAQQRLRALSSTMREAEHFADLAVAFKRVANIIKDHQAGEVDPALFQLTEERELHEVYLAVAPEFRDHVQARSYEKALRLLAGQLRGPVDRFFEKVLVNDPKDPARQANRKALLSKIAALFGVIADFTRLQFREFGTSDKQRT